MLKRLWVAGFLVLVLGIVLFKLSTPSHAYACDTLPSDKGTLSYTVNLPTTATYRIWTHLYSPSANHNGVYLQVDKACQLVIGHSSSIPVDQFSWIDYQNGNTTQKVDLALLAGSHTITVAGLDSDVGVDRLLFTTDTGCVPSSNGTVCSAATASLPTVPNGPSTHAGPSSSTQQATPPSSASPTKSVSMVALARRPIMAIVIAAILLTAGGTIGMWLWWYRRHPYSVLQTLDTLHLRQEARFLHRLWLHIKSWLTYHVLFSRLAHPVIIITVFALSGTVALRIGLASPAPTVVVIDLKQATLSGGASVVVNGKAFDGQMVRFATPGSPATATNQSSASVAAKQWPLTNLKVVSYYPSANSWEYMWLNWQPTTIDADFARIADLHANTVRIFVPPKAFGYPSVSDTMENELEQTITMADKHGLRVWLNLFDVGFTQWSDTTGSKQWASEVLTPFQADTRVAVVEVRNEVDPAQAAQMTWAQALIPYVRSQAQGIPVAISICGCDNAGSLTTLKNNLSNAQPDLYSFHYYASTGGSPLEAQWQSAAYVFGKVKAAVAPIPAVVGETGFSTASGTEDQQTLFWQAMAAASRTAGLSPPGVWVLNEFSTNTTEQNHFGLYRTDGSAKPAASAVSAMFSP